jgi:hypothetical protein
MMVRWPPPRFVFGQQRARRLHEERLKAAARRAEEERTAPKPAEPVRVVADPPAQPTAPKAPAAEPGAPVTPKRGRRKGSLAYDRTEMRARIRRWLAHGEIQQQKDLIAEIQDAYAPKYPKAPSERLIKEEIKSLREGHK